MSFSINGYGILNVIWNLFLLLIPFFLCLGLIRLWQKTNYNRLSTKIFAVFLSCLWLGMIPNSAYVITDVRHIVGFCPVNDNNICIENAWHILFFFSYALIGFVSFIYFINQMKYLINEIFGRKLAKIYIFAIIPLMSLGVLLGLVNRLNTWNLITNPFYIFENIRLYFTNFVYFKNLVIFVIFFYIFYFVGDLLLKPFLYYGLFKDRKSI